MRRNYSSWIKAWVRVCVAAGLVGCGGSDSPAPPAQISVTSTRADFVTDGDARIEAVLPQGVDPASAKVTVNGRDVTTAFVPSSGKLQGLVTGLTVGSNSIAVSANGATTASLEVKNTGRGGPLFSGPQSTPYFCATPTPQAASANSPASMPSGLGTFAVDAQCNIATEYKYFYRTTAAGCLNTYPDPSPPAPAPVNSCYKPYDPSADTPSDLASATTDSGVIVPFIVRVERGTMNRGIYEMAVLADPKKALSAQPIWNGKAMFAFGGGGGQPRRQQRPLSLWTDDDAISRGWIVTVNNLLEASLNNNRMVIAESVMMMKEHIEDTYGPLKFTVGKGPSGGTMTSYMLASLYPGVLDGALIYLSLLDYDTSHTENWECSQLVEFYESASWKSAMAAGGYSQSRINAKKAAINGHVDHTTCQAWFNSFGQLRFVGNTLAGRTIPAANRDTGAIALSQLAAPVNGCALPASMVYDPVTNPTGIRCGPWDWMAGMYGTTNGGGNSTRDNTGVQYGLLAVRSGEISPEEFVVVNESVGGLGRDGTIVPARSLADPMALEVAYGTGLIAARNLGTIALIDMRGWDDSTIAPSNGVTPAGSGLHQQWRSFGVRARLDEANGHHDNQVIWRYGRNGVAPSAAMYRDALIEMDKWLSAVKSDTSTAPISQKIVSAKPSSVFDFCYLSTDAAQATKVTDKAACDADPLLKFGKSPRQAAGGPITENILKCQLKPIAASDYLPAVLASEQITRLQSVFPGGVCDWSKPGVSQQATGDAPYTFVNGPGGQPIGPAPTSKAIQ